MKKDAQTPIQAAPLPETPSNSTTLSDRRGNEQWPVLARLPEVSPPTSSAPRSNRSAAGLVEYRFDPPQIAASNVTQRATNVRHSAKPHVFERDPGTGQGARPRRFVSPILPHSDPFAIPRSGLRDALAPAVRFLMMFALFTAAGTSILMFNRQVQPTAEPVKPAAATVQPMLVPAADAVQLSPAPPTAAGPIDATTPRTGRRNNDGSQSAIRKESIRRGGTSEIVAELPEMRQLSAHGIALPRVQSTDPQTAGVEDSPARKDVGARPPAVAHLSPYILEDPTRQAQHVDHESSLH